MPTGPARLIDPRGRVARRAFWLFTAKAWAAMGLALLIGILTGFPVAWFAGAALLALPGSLAMLLRRLRDAGGSVLLVPALVVSFVVTLGAGYVFAVIAAGGLEPSRAVNATAVLGGVATIAAAIAILRWTVAPSRA